MKFDWLVSTAVAVLMLGVSPSFAASNSTKVCALLTREELMATGVAITAQGLMPDDPVSLKKGSLPGLITDIKIDQCTSEMAAHDTAFPVRWSVGTTKDPIDKKAWEKMADALDQDEKESAGDSEQRLTIDGTDCETFSWPEKAGKHIYAVSCTAHKGAHHVTLEFSHTERAKLLPAKTVKQLLDKMLARL
jgi:hypothetical protein